MAENETPPATVSQPVLRALLQQELVAARRQRSRMGWLMAGTALASLAVLLGAAFGPLRDRIGADVTARLQRDLTAEMRAPLQSEAAAAARQETARLLREDAQSAALRGLLLAEAQRMLAPDAGISSAGTSSAGTSTASAGDNLRDPLRGAMADRAALQFRAPQPELAGFAFRILDLLDPALARQELMRALQADLAGGGADAGTGAADMRLAAAFQALAQPGSATVPLALVAPLAEQALRVAQRHGDAAFTTALGGWLARLEPAEAVADWLQSRAPAAAGAGLPVVWQLLLQDSRPPARARLLTLLETGPEAQVQAALAALAAPGQAWPPLPALEARRLLAAIEAKLPNALLAPAGLEGTALEARYALNRAAILGQPALRFAMPIWAGVARAAGQPGWDAALRGLEAAVNAQAPTAAQGTGTTQAPGALASLPLAVGAEGPWTVLLQRLLMAADAAAPGEALAALLPAADTAPDVAGRRLAVLALAAGGAGPGGPASAAVVRELGLPAALLPPLLAATATPARDLALLRLTALASPEVCDVVVNAAIARAEGLPAVVIAALAGCAAADGPLPTARIADWLHAVPADGREAAARLAALAGGRPDGAPWATVPGGNARLQLVADLGAAPPIAPDAAALRLLAQLRPGLPAEVDRLLADGSRLILPAAGTDDALPDWATTGFWQAALAVSVEAGEPQARSLATAGEQRLAVTCPPALSLRARLEGPRGRLALLALPASQPPRSGTGLGHDARTGLGGASGAASGAAFGAGAGGGDTVREVEAPCAGGIHLLVRNAADAQLLLKAEPPVREVPLALRAEDADATEPLRPDEPLRIRLEQGQSAFFRIAPEAGADYTIITRNLTGETDTVLEALSETGSVIAEDDDGGTETLSSRLTLQRGDATALVRAGTLGTAGRFELLLTREAPVPPAEFGMSQADAGALPPSGSKLHIGLRRGHSAFFALPEGAALLVETVDLRRGTDTVLELLDAEGRKLAEDDDGGDQELASALELPAQPRPAWLRVGTLEGAGGDFNLTVRPAQPAEPADFPQTLEEAQQQPALAIGETRTMLLRRRQTAYFALPTGRDLAALTRDLRQGADTVLELLDAKGAVLAEDDDGGDEDLASRLDLTSSRKGPFFLRVRSLDGSGGRFELVLEQASPVEPPSFATSLAQATARPALAVGATAHLRLARGQSAFFALPDDRALVAMTSNLRRNADTVLEVLDANGRVLAEDDDGGREALASRVAIPARRPAFLRVGTLEETGGEFDLVLEAVRRR